MLPSLLLCHKSPGLANLTVGDLCLSRLPAVTTGQLLSFLLQLSYSQSRVIVARAVANANTCLRLMSLCLGEQYVSCHVDTSVDAPSVAEAINCFQ